MMSATRDGLHTVEVEIGRYGITSLSFRCLADGATDPECHMVCPRPECEEGCVDSSAHDFENAQECMVTTWLENSDSKECVLGAETRVTLPIEYVWHGEGVDWAFAAEGVTQ